jgi:hypothetical protein
MGGATPKIYVRPIPDYPAAKWRSTYSAHTRRNPPSREPGVDYYCPLGTVLHSLGDGVVTEVGGSVFPATGRFVRVRLDTGHGFRLLHLGPRHSLKRVGDRVKLGEPLAISGASGYGSEYFGASRPNDAQMILNTGGPHTHLTLFPKWYSAYAEAIDPEPWMMDPSAAGGGATPFPIKREDAMPVFIRNSARGDYVVEPGVVRYLGRDSSVLNVVQHPDGKLTSPEEINIIDVIDQNLDAVLFGLAGISPEEIAVLPAGATWADQKLTSNPWINYGEDRHTQEIVLRSLDAKATAILERLAPERLAQIQAETAAAVDDALADNFEAIPAEVREEFKTDPLS